MKQLSFQVFSEWKKSEVVKKSSENPAATECGDSSVSCVVPVAVAPKKEGSTNAELPIAFIDGTHKLDLNASISPLVKYT